MSPAATKEDVAEAQRRLDEATVEIRQVMGELAIQESVAEALGLRIDQLESERPKNSMRIKPRDGHHHMESVRVLDSDVDKGFGFELNFRHGISATRDSFPTNRRFDVDAGGGICYDYLVDADFTGTAGTSIPQVGGGSTILYKTIQAAIDAIDAVNNEVSLLICPGTYSEDVLFPSTLAHDLYIDGLGARTAVWGRSGQGDALTLDGSATVWFSRIQFRGAGGSHSVTSAGSNVTAHFRDCETDAPVSADFDGSSFIRHKFDGGYDVDSGDTPQGVFFYRCSFTGTQTWVDDVDDHYFRDCEWPGASDEITVSSAADLTDVHFKGGTAGTSGATKRWLHVNTTGKVNRLHVEGMSMPQPQDANGVIYLQACGASTGGNVIANNSYPHTTGGTFPYITSDDADFVGFTFIGNAFEKANGNYLEDDGSTASIDGNFTDSNFGPNTPASKVEYNITGTGNTFFPTQAAVGSSTSPAISSRIEDADGDTFVDVEKTADEDIIHFDAGGVADIMTIAEHGVDIHHTATASDEHALELEVDAAGFGDVKAIDIAYDTGALATGEAEAIVLVNINEIDATGGDIFAFLVLSTEGGANEVFGLGIGATVGPIHQDSGTFANPTTGTNNTASTDVADMIDGSEGTNTTIFVADNDFIIIGAAAAFTELEFDIETGAGQPGIKPTFAYSTSGSGQFTTFSPIDGTNGFRNTGIVLWEADELTGHTTNDDTGTFDIKITRTHAVAGSVSLFFAKTATTVSFSWDKAGDVSINNFDAAGDADIAKHLAVGGGASINAERIVEVNETFTNRGNSTTQHGIRSQLTGDGTGTSRTLAGITGAVSHKLTSAPSGVFGLDYQVTIDAGSVGGTNIKGARIVLLSNTGASGNFTDLIGFELAQIYAGTTKADTVRGLKLPDLSLWGAASDTVYGIQIDAFDGDANPTRWPFFYGDVGSPLFTIDHAGDATGTVLYLAEQAEASANRAGFGQIWVNTATPNELFFTPDDDADQRIDHTGPFPTTWSDTSITGAELEDLSDGGATTLHTHAGAGLGTMTTVKESGSQVGGADIVTLDFGAGFDVAETPDTEVNITLDLDELSPSRTFVLTAQGGSPTTTAGCAGPKKVEAGTNDVDYWVLDFDTGTDENAFWGPIDTPDNWDGGTLTARFTWTAASGSGTVAWAIQMIAADNDDPIDQAWGAAVVTTDTLIAAGDIHKTATSGAITPATSVSRAGGDSLFIRVFRDVSADNLGVDARLMHVRLTYTTNAYSD